MKKITLILIAALFCNIGFAQDNAVSKYFSDYQKSKDFTKLSVTSKMFALFADIDTKDPDQQELVEAMSKIKGVKGVIKENAENASELFTQAVAKVTADGKYEELMSVEDATENILFMVLDNGGEINELLMVVGGNKHFMVMSLYGVIDLSQIAKLSSVMNINGMEQFRMLEKKGNKKEEGAN